MWEASSKPVIRDDGEWYASASKAAESIGAERSSVAKAIRRGSSIYGHTFRYADKLKRPALKMRDADGVEINVGDKVWLLNGIDNELVVEEIDDESGWVGTRSANGACLSVYNTHLTHIAPDSWERLEEDAEFNDETGIVGGNLDIVRRAKALAGVEVDE